MPKRTWMKRTISGTGREEAAAELRTQVVSLVDDADFFFNNEKLNDSKNFLN